MMYFVIIIAVCAAGLIWFVAKTTRNGNRARQGNRKKVSRYLHQPAQHPQLHNLSFRGHAHQSNSSMRDVWAARKRRGTEEARGSYSLTARKIETDAELEASRESDDLSMTAIEYIPTQLERASGKKP
ncbi:MAG TPA: hypothetical protein VI566_03195 [Xanthomonadales bacterium]|nr:hypothetical protein [Xanthomonadales bacterium]